MRNPKNGDWTLTEESKHPVEAAEGTIFRHIEASRIGTELAVVDGHGKVQVYSSIHSPLGKLSQAPQQSEETKNLGSDLDVVIGLHWLALWPTEFRVGSRAEMSAGLDVLTFQDTIYYSCTEGRREMDVHHAPSRPE